MAEDRFEDLDGTPAGHGEQNGWPAGADPPPRRPEVQPRGNRYAWVVGIVLLMLVSGVLFTTALPNAGGGLRGIEPGSPLPAFAAPLVTGDKEGDANVCQRASECNEEAGTVPACEVRSEGIFNLCEARERPLVLTFVFDKGADCNPQVDRVERMKDEFGAVNFAVVYFSDEERVEVAEIVRRRGWTMPVAHTRDGAVVNLYGVGGCPTTVFAFRGGRALESVLGPISEQGLRERARRLVRDGGTP